MDAARFQQPRRRRIPVSNRWGSGELAVLDFGDPDRAVDLVFLHANGFNALTYRSLLAPLAASLRIIVPDLRGHGATTLPARPEGRRSWHDLRDDTLDLLQALGGPPVTLAGHSMGGTVALLAAAQSPERVSNLVLLDPVVWTRTLTLMMNLPGMRLTARRIPLVAGALRRRNRFDSPKAALDSWVGRGAFKGWPEAVVADYAAGGLVAAPDGGVVLACEREWEAAGYAAQAHNPWRALKAVNRPVRVVRAQHNSTCYIRPAEMRRLPLLKVEEPRDVSHFFPMTHPELAREALIEAAT